MVKGNDKLDGVSKRIEHDHIAIKSELLDFYKQLKVGNSGNNSQGDDINIDDNMENEDEHQQNDNHNGEHINIQNDSDVVMRDMTPFVSVDQAKFTTDSRVDISYDRRRFTDVCFIFSYFA